MIHKGRSGLPGKILPGLLIFVWLSSGHLALDQEIKSAERDTKREPTVRRLIDRLSIGKQASKTADALIARGEPAVQDLMRAATNGRKISIRGWAIVCLSEIGGIEAADCLSELSKDGKQPPLVRAWAAAGRINMTRSMEDLLELEDLILEIPALNRPAGRKIFSLISAKEDTNPADELLRFTLRNPKLEQTLGKSILALGSRALIESLLSANSQNVRRQAAAYLGTLDARGKQPVAQEIVSTLKFDRNAKAVPWSGGPLFLPALQWSQKDSQALFGNLVAWLLWCERNKVNDAQDQIRLNLQSATLSEAAEYQRRGFGAESNDNWLSEWGRTAGKKELLNLLSEQGVADDPRYKTVLDNLESFKNE